MEIVKNDTDKVSWGDAKCRLELDSLIFCIGSKEYTASLENLPRTYTVSEVFRPVYMLRLEEIES